MELAGIVCVRTGTDTTVTTTTIGGMDAPSGDGVAIAVSECICIACALYTVITKVVGVVSAPTGISTGATTTIDVPDGSGVDTAAWAAICIVCAFFNDSTAHGGTKSAATGTCTDAITTTIISMGDIGGRGDVTGVSVCTCIGCVPCTVTIRVIGVACDRTGTCGVATTTTSGHAGSGPTHTAVWAAINIDCACSSAGMVLDGTL